MTEKDVKMIKESQQELIEHLTEVLDLKFELVNRKLDATIVQTTKTNGTIINHERRLTEIEREIPHTISRCPQNQIIQTLRDEMITKKSIKRMFITMVAVLGGLIGIVATILAMTEQIGK